MSSDATAFTLVHDDSSDQSTTQDLRLALEKGNDDVKLDTLRRIIVSTLNGQPQVSVLTESNLPR